MAANAVLPPFNRLPVEILLKIALFAPGLDSLCALNKASARFALVFDQYGSDILECVLDTAGGGENAHYQLRDIIRLVIHVRTIYHDTEPLQTPTVLDVFLDQLFERTPNSVVYTPIPRGTPPSILRDVLAIAATIAQLAPLCLAAHLRRCLALRPSHPISRARPKPGGEFMGDRPAYLDRPGYTYAPHSSGPPSWLERARALRAFWTVQLYLDLCRGVANGRIVFAEEGHEGRRELDASKMDGIQGYYLVSGERAVKTVVEWLCEDVGWMLPECKAGEHLKQENSRMDTPPLHLPCPPEQEIEQAFDWENEGKGWFPGCEEEFVFQYDKLHITSLHTSPGENFLDVTMWHMGRFSPVYKIGNLPIFRRLGIAFWDSRRLMGFELLGPVSEDGFDDTGKDRSRYFRQLELMYTWISIADAAPSQV